MFIFALSIDGRWWPIGTEADRERYQSWSEAEKTLKFRRAQFIAKLYVIDEKQAGKPTKEKTYG